MEGNYQVCFGKRVVGSVTVFRQGLYYRFVCRCRLTGNVICRLRVQCGSSQQDLGIPVPVGDEFMLDTKLPSKRFEKGIAEFSLVPKNAAISGMLIPIYPEEPFAYIEKLKYSFLVKSGNQFSISIKEPGH